MANPLHLKIAVSFIIFINFDVNDFNNKSSSGE